jgi:hypothetical protein
VNEDDAKKAILARRARFVAAALALTAAGCDKKKPPPHPCLSPPINTLPQECLAVPQACLKAHVPPRPDAAPEVCLSQPMPRHDAGIGPPPPPGKKDSG